MTVASQSVLGSLRGQRRSLPELIADTIADAIASGSLTAGERVVETTLAEKLGVSRVPIREALKVLHAQGILSGGEHKGFRASAFDARRIRQVLEVRVDLEVLLLRDAIQVWRSKSVDLAPLRTAVETMRRAVKLEDLPAALRADIGFHRVICDASENEVAGTLWQAIARHVLIIFSLERRDPSALGDLVAQHESMLDFIGGQVRAPGGSAILRRHLEEHILLFDPLPSDRGMPARR